MAGITVEKIKRWLKLKADFDRGKIDENELRKDICSEVLGKQTKGVKHLVYEDFKVSATGKVNLKINKDDLKAMWGDLTPAEKKSITFEPKISQADFNKLAKDSKVRRAITVKPGMASLKITTLNVK